MSAIDYENDSMPYLLPLSTRSIDWPALAAPMTTHTNRLPWRRRLATWLTEPMTIAEVNRVADLAETWAENERTARLIRRLDAVRRAPGAAPLVDADWREREPSPNCVGDV